MKFIVTLSDNGEEVMFAEDAPRGLVWYCPVEEVKIGIGVLTRELQRVAKERRTSCPPSNLSIRCFPGGKR